MGRYYNGDIEGKFWFGIQSSDDADFFGFTGYQPEELHYEFEKDNLPDVEYGISLCKEELGDYEKRIDDFFDSVTGWNDKIVADHGFDVKEFNAKMVWYARLKLGEKIRDCIKEKGQCYFEAEM